MNIIGTNSTAKISNFNHGETPALAQTIGDILLIAGGIGAAILALPAVLPAAVVLPVLLTQIGVWAAAIGAVGKLFSKFISIKQAI